MNLSIITVNYNDVNGLQRTISSLESLLIEYSDEVELIVVDGASNDGSIQFINQKRSIISHAVIEPDNGIYDAMNKGLIYARGKFAFFLNSGDYINGKHALYRLLIVSRQFKNDKVVFWRALIVNEKCEAVKAYPLVKKEGIDRWMNYPLNLPNHQAMLFPFEFYKTNKYDLKFKINGDADYKCRAINQFGYVFLDEVLSCFVLGGISSRNLTWSHYVCRINELLYFVKKNYRGIKALQTSIIEMSKLTLKLLIGMMRRKK